MRDIVRAYIAPIVVISKTLQIVSLWINFEEILWSKRSAVYPNPEPSMPEPTNSLTAKFKSVNSTDMYKVYSRMSNELKVK